MISKTNSRQLGAYVIAWQTILNVRFSYYRGGIGTVDIGDEVVEAYFTPDRLLAFNLISLDDRFARLRHLGVVPGTPSWFQSTVVGLVVWPARTLLRNRDPIGLSTTFVSVGAEVAIANRS